MVKKKDFEELQERVDDLEWFGNKRSETVHIDSKCRVEKYEYEYSGYDQYYITHREGSVSEFTVSNYEDKKLTTGDYLFCWSVVAFIFIVGLIVGVTL